MILFITDAAAHCIPMHGQSTRKIFDQRSRAKHAVPGGIKILSAMQLHGRREQNRDQADVPRRIRLHSFTQDTGSSLKIRVKTHGAQFHALHVQEDSDGHLQF